MTTFTRAEAFAPASMGNVGVGFDVLGLAYTRPGDTVLAELHDGQGALIKTIEGDQNKLPYDPDKNTATVAANAFLRMIGSEQGVALTIRKGMPLASGLGGSAASAVAAVVAVNALLGSPLSKGELLPACLDGEALISGYHADNIGPCLLGGITLVGGIELNQLQPLPVPDGMVFALVTANVEVPTAQARAVLPKEVPLKSMISMTAEIAKLVDALHRGDIRAAAQAMEGDIVVEPARQHLIPKLLEVRSAAKKAGALGMVISGAGPTLCAVCDSKVAAEAALNDMIHVYVSAGIGCIGNIAEVDKEGARVLRLE